MTDPRLFASRLGYGLMSSLWNARSDVTRIVGGLLKTAVGYLRFRPTSLIIDRVMPTEINRHSPTE